MSNIFFLLRWPIAYCVSCFWVVATQFHAISWPWDQPSRSLAGLVGHVHNRQQNGSYPWTADVGSPFLCTLEIRGGICQNRVQTWKIFWRLVPLRTSCYPKRIQKVTLFGRSQKTFHNFSHSWLKDSNLTRCNQMVNFPWLWQKRRAKGDTLKGVEVTQIMLGFFGNPPFPGWFFPPGFNLIFIWFFFGGHNVAFHGHFSMQIIIQPRIALGFRYPGTSSPAVAVYVGSDKESAPKWSEESKQDNYCKTPSPISFDFSRRFLYNTHTCDVRWT